MAFNKDELKNIQNQSINQEHVDYIYKLFDDATIQLADAVQTEEFEDWLQETLKDIIGQGKIPYIGFGFKQDPNDPWKMSLLVCSKYNHIFKECVMDVDLSIVSYTEQELSAGLTNWINTGISKLIKPLYETMMLKLDLNILGEPNMIKDENEAILFMSKISLD